MSNRRTSSIDSNPAVRRVAEILKIRARNNLQEAIREVALCQVESWIQEFQVKPTSLDDVHHLVLNQTGVRIIRVDSDAALREAAREIERTHPALPVQLEFEFQRQTEALVIRNPLTDRRLCNQYVAVVDARGERRWRAWFGERHEPAHVLIKDPNVNVVVRRTRIKRPEPLEQVVDAVASAVGFWEPLVRPVLSQTLRSSSNVLDALEQTRVMVAPRASKEASYRAFIALLERPLVIIRAGFDCRAADKREGGDPGRSLALRAVTVLSNRAAQDTGLVVWPHYRIPADSVIASAHAHRWTVLAGDDNTGRWPCETGRPLPNRAVRIVAYGPWATIEPAE